MLTLSIYIWTVAITGHAANEPCRMIETIKHYKQEQITFRQNANVYVTFFKQILVFLYSLILNKQITNFKIALYFFTSTKRKPGYLFQDHLQEISATAW
jgi:hypothetical protein